jgi:hypothetical protein
MTNLPTNAQICEVDGAFYDVRLWSVPHIGDLIDLFSMIDLHDQREPAHQYQVAQVVHAIRDVIDKTDPPSWGQHLVRIWVKPASSDFFGA